MATVLKSKQFPAGTNTASIEVFNWEDVATRARSYLTTVRQQADEILRQAAEEANQMRLAAQEQGRAAGQSDIVATAETIATKIADQRVREATQSIHRLADELEDATHQWLRQWQHETVPLAVAIAERLVRRQLDIEPTILLEWLQESVRLAQANQQTEIRMHPHDIEVLGPSLTRFLDEQRNRVALTLVPDESIDRHGIVVRSSEMTIDQQLKKQLDRLREELQ